MSYNVQRVSIDGMIYCDFPDIMAIITPVYIEQMLATRGLHCHVLYFVMRKVPWLGVLSTYAASASMMIMRVSRIVNLRLKLGAVLTTH